MRAKSSSRSGQRGSTLILFTLMMPTLVIPLVGLGIDATMCYIVQAKLGAAVDGAALGAGRLLGTPAIPAEIANEFLQANFRANGITAGFWGANTLLKTITYTPGITKTIKVDANVRVPLLFARVFGQSYATVSAVATAARTDSRIMLVLDRSGSMSGAAITAMIAKATAFTQSFTPATDEVGLVVFGGSGIVAYPATRPWSPTIGVTGGPDTNFVQTVTPADNMLTQIGYITSGSYTNSAEALSLAYIELQKAHMRDTGGGGADPRMNSIVFMTDGAPTAVSVYLNNPADDVVKDSSPCNYRTPGSHGTPTPPLANQQMRAWIGTAHQYGRLMSTDTDPAFNVQSYLQNGNNDLAYPYVTTPVTNCNFTPPVAAQVGPPAVAAVPAGPWWTTRLLSDTSDLARFPNSDMYGNPMDNNNYTNSSFIDGAGTVTTPYSGWVRDFNMANWTSTTTADNNIKMASWNAADSAGLRIRTDANRNIVGGRPDSQAMAITIYAIGYLGSGGLDDGLLKRITNDTSSSSYVPAQGTGVYIPASNAAELDAAFNKVAGMILRLSR